MAVADAIVWNLRPLDGDDSNGGAFVEGATGTDFSLQASPQQVYTDLVAVTGTTISSAGRPFSSVDVGNVINITSGSGWNTGRYNIISVASGVATVNGTIATSSSTGGHGNYGGAVQTLGFLTGLTLSTVRAKVRAQSGITVPARLDFANNNHLELIGYGSTPGDGGRVNVTTSASIDPMFLTRNAGAWTWQNFAFSDTSGTRHACIVPIAAYNNFNVVNCTFDGFTSAIDFNSQNVFNCLLQYNTIKNSGSDGIKGAINVKSGQVISCYFKNNTGNGISIGTTSSAAAIASLTFLRCVFKGNAIAIFCSNDNGSSGGSNNAAVYVINCTIRDNSSDGVKLNENGTAHTIQLHLLNNIFWNNGGKGVNVGASGITGPYQWMFGGYNGFGSNTGGDRANFPTLPGDYVLTADPNTDASTDDFTLNGTAGGGVMVVDSGFPQSFPP